MEQTSSQTAFRVALGTIAAILVVLAILGVIAWLAGNPTTERHQPEPSPASTASTP